MILDSRNIRDFVEFIKKNVKGIDVFNFIRELITSEYFIPALDLFIELGGKVNIVDADGRTPIFILTSFDATHVIANPIDMLGPGVGALQSIVTNNIYQGIEILIKNGVDINHVAKDGSNAAHHIYFPLRDIVVKLLVKSNIDLTKVNANHKMPIVSILINADYATIVNIIKYSGDQMNEPPYLPYVKSADTFIALMKSKNIKRIHELLNCGDKMQPIYQSLYKRFGLTEFKIFH